MIITLYSIILALIQLILLIIYFIKRYDITWQSFVSTSISNVLINMLTIGYLYISGYADSWDGLRMLMESTILIVINSGLFIIGKIVSFFINKSSSSHNTIEILDITTSEKEIISNSDTTTDTNKETKKTPPQKTPHSSKQIISTKVKKFTLSPKVTYARKKIYLILLLTTVVIFLTDIGYNMSYKYRINKQKETCKKTVQRILAEKYGYCDFKIDDVKYYDHNDSDLFDTVKPHFTFTVSSNILDKTSSARINLDHPNELASEDFLDVYYKHEYNVTSISKYIEELAEETFKSELSNKFNINISLNATSDYFYDHKLGTLPTPDILLNYVTLKDVEIEILDNLLTEEQLNKYLISLTNYILNSTSKNSLQELESDIIFKFKCNYQNMNLTYNAKEYDECCGYVAKLNSSTIKILAFDKVTNLPIEQFVTSTN